MKRVIGIMMFIFWTGNAQINDSIPVAGRWDTERINKWYKEQPWLVGCNYYPATAINQIEMWQKSTWDPDRIDLELGWAETIGMNTLRVYLHDLVWEDDEKGLYDRMDKFLDICDSHGIRPFFVFFDDCHMPDPILGKQPLPVRGYHNSGWVNSPSRQLAIRYAEGNATPEEVKRLKGYVQKTMQRFSEDNRILMWELYNEPGRGQGLTGTMESTSVSDAFGDRSKQLVYDSWCWAREVNPSQPITSTTLGAVGKTNIKINKINSDVNSVHSYAEWERTVKRLEPYMETGRPIFLTEWLGRHNGSTVKNILPKLKQNNIAAINWGFVSGKTGTIWHWNSRTERDIYKERKDGNVVKPGEPFPEPDLWFHDIFRVNGEPYDEEEIQLFKNLTGVQGRNQYKREKR